MCVLSLSININVKKSMMYKVVCVLRCSTCTAPSVYLCVCLEEVLLHPDSLLLLLKYSVFDDPDEVIWPSPGLGLQAGIKARDAL